MPTESTNSSKQPSKRCCLCRFSFHIHIPFTEMKEGNGWYLDPEIQRRPNHERELTVPLGAYIDSCPTEASIIKLD